MTENPSAISEHWLPAGRKRSRKNTIPETSLVIVLVMHFSIYQDGSVCIKQDTRKGSAKGRLEAGAHPPSEGFPASMGIQHQDAADSLHKYPVAPSV